MEKMNDKNQSESEMKNPENVLPYDYLDVIEVPQQCQEKRLNFSIDYILGNDDKKESHFNHAKIQYDWLSYTRYRPPKLQSKFKRLNQQPFC